MNKIEKKKLCPRTTQAIQFSEIKDLDPTDLNSVISN